MTHGRAVLKAAKLKKPKPYSGPMADWSDWRLVLEGKEYKPLWSSYEEWVANYASRTK